MWLATKESPDEAYKKLKKYIRHTHLKDANLVEGKFAYTLLGQGNVPIFKAITVLAKNGYRGYYSFEWEKMWYPEIAEPEIALAHYPKAIQQHFKKI
jgi:sugar phosphate isomerase/epimerase